MSVWNCLALMLSSFALGLNICNVIYVYSGWSSNSGSVDCDDETEDDEETGEEDEVSDEEDYEEERQEGTVSHTGKGKKVFFIGLLIVVIVATAMCIYGVHYKNIKDTNERIEESVGKYLDNVADDSERFAAMLILTAYDRYRGTDFLDVIMMTDAYCPNMERQKDSCPDIHLNWRRQLNLQMLRFWIRTKEIGSISLCEIDSISIYPRDWQF